jgi:hypothetical protein
MKKSANSGGVLMHVVSDKEEKVLPLFAITYSKK